MIETTAQREKRIKGEAAERERRAKRNAEVLVRQNAELGLPQAANPVTGIPATARGVATFGTITINESKPMTVLTAKSLTAQIKDKLEGAAKLIAMAHKLEAWRILGYTSWVEYCEKEFGFSRQRGYQLMDFAETTENIAEGVSTNCRHLPERESQTRPLAGLPAPKQRTAWKRAVKAAGGQPTAKQVAAQVAAMKPAKAREIATESNLPMHTTSAPTEPKTCPHCGQAIPKD